MTNSDIDNEIQRDLADVPSPSTVAHTKAKPTMRPITIRACNSRAIEAALAAVNGRKTAHTYTTYEEIYDVACRADDACFRFGLTQKEKVGAIYTAQSGERLPKAYRYVADSTVVVLKRLTVGWALVEVRHAPLYPGTGGKESLTVTPEQADAACARLRATVRIREAS